MPSSARHITEPSDIHNDHFGMMAESFINTNTMRSLELSKINESRT